MREKLARFGLALLLLAPSSLLAACENEDLRDVREGTRDVGNELDEAEDKLDKEIGDDDKGKD